MKVRFKNQQKLEFYVALRSEVDNYFKENNLSKQANSKMWVKVTLILTSFFFIYFTLLFAEIPNVLKLALTIPFGFITALIGLNICHDAIHGALSEKRWVNKLFSILFNIVGANAYMWNITHNIVHHTYTNIKGADEDIDIAPGLIRMHESDEWKPIYKYQHIYAFFLYGLTSLSWVFRKDFVKFFQKKIGNYNNTNHPKKELYVLVFFKVVYMVLFIVLPLILMDITVLQFIAGFLLMHVIQGFTLALVFQPAHAVENVDFPLPNEKGIIPEEWAAHQLQTCSNFANKSKLATWLTGGLNFQIEHHLFPTICHIHYPKLAPIIRETAQKFNLPYHENLSYYKAIQSHYHLLKSLGTRKKRN